MSKPRESGRYNALTLRTRLTDLVEAKTNFITAYHDGAGIATVMITVPLTQTQYNKNTAGFTEASTPENMAAVLAEMAVRASGSDEDMSLESMLGTAFVAAEHEGPACIPDDADVTTISEGEGYAAHDHPADLHDTEELPPGSAERLSQHSRVDPDIADDAADGEGPRVAAEGDLVYLISSRKKAYQIVALGTHVATLSHVLDDGSVAYVTVPYGTFGFVDDIMEEGAA